MNIAELETYLNHINIFEQKQRETGISVNDISGLDTSQAHYEPGTTYFRIPKHAFFSDGNNIVISRHNRFAPMQEQDSR